MSLPSAGSKFSHIYSLSKWCSLCNFFPRSWNLLDRSAHNITKSVQMLLHHMHRLLFLTVRLNKASTVAKQPFNAILKDSRGVTSDNRQFQKVKIRDPTLMCLAITVAWSYSSLISNINNKSLYFVSKGLRDHLSDWFGESNALLPVNHSENLFSRNGLDNVA